MSFEPFEPPRSILKPAGLTVPAYSLDIARKCWIAVKKEKQRVRFADQTSERIIVTVGESESDSDPEDDFAYLDYDPAIDYHPPVLYTHPPSKKKLLSQRIRKRAAELFPFLVDPLQKQHRKRYRTDEKYRRAYDLHVNPPPKPKLLAIMPPEEEPPIEPLDPLLTFHEPILEEWFWKAIEALEALDSRTIDYMIWAAISVSLGAVYFLTFDWKLIIFSFLGIALFSWRYVTMWRFIEWVVRRTIIFLVYMPVWLVLLIFAILFGKLAYKNKKLQEKLVALFRLDSLFEAVMAYFQ